MVDRVRHQLVENEKKFREENFPKGREKIVSIESNL